MITRYGDPFLGWLSSLFEEKSLGVLCYFVQEYYFRYLGNNTNLCKLAFNYAVICQTLGMVYPGVEPGICELKKSYFNA